VRGEVEKKRKKPNLVVLRRAEKHYTRRWNEEDARKLARRRDSTFAGRKMKMGGLGVTRGEEIERLSCSTR